MLINLILISNSWGCGGQQFTIYWIQVAPVPCHGNLLEHWVTPFSSRWEEIEFTLVIPNIDIRKRDPPVTRSRAASQSTLVSCHERSALKAFRITLMRHLNPNAINMSIIVDSCIILCISHSFMIIIICCMYGCIHSWYTIRRNRIPYHRWGLEHGVHYLLMSNYSNSSFQ